MDVQNDHVTSGQRDDESLSPFRSYGTGSPSQQLATPVARFRTSISGRSRNDSGYLSSSPALSTSSRTGSASAGPGYDTDTDLNNLSALDLEELGVESEEVFLQDGHNCEFSNSEDEFDDLNTIHGSQNSETDSGSTLTSINLNGENDFLAETCLAFDQNEVFSEYFDMEPKNDVECVEENIEDSEIADINDSMDTASAPIDMPARPSAPIPLDCIFVESNVDCCSEHFGRRVFVPIPFRQDYINSANHIHRVNTVPVHLNTEEFVVPNGCAEHEQVSTFGPRHRSASLPEVQTPQQEVGRQLRRLSDQFYFEYANRRRARGMSLQTPTFYVNIDIQSGGLTPFAANHDQQTQTEDDDVDMQDF